MGFTLEQILDSAASHPFYSNDVTSSERTLSAFPLLEKTKLHNSIQLAMQTDRSFLRSVYISPTSGSSSNTRFFFVTDAAENRQQRKDTAGLMRYLHTIDENDVVLNLHCGISLYRSLELAGDLIEYAGGTNIPAGHSLPDEDLVDIANQFRANVITGTSSRLLTFARYLQSKPEINLSLAKAFYTSEPLSVYQEEYLRKAFRCEFIVSCYGSAECGAWACSPPSKTFHSSKPYREFVFRVDAVIVEIINDDGTPVPDGGVGEIVLTSLMRIRNPLVRYRSGDIGSLHPYIAGDEDTRAQYRCIRLYGRHPEKSFNLNGEYFDVDYVEKVMKQGRWGILEWQIILESDHIGQREESVEVRVVLENKELEEQLGGLRSELIKIGGGESIMTADISIKAVEYADLEKSLRANKIRKIVDRR